MPANPRQRRRDRHAPSPSAPAASITPRKLPLTVERITDAALEVVATQNYDALTMRSVAKLLDTGPASLYAHVVNKADLDELIIGRLCNQLVLPTPDAARWREQIADVCAQLRDQYLAYPGISRAAFAMVATDLDVLRVAEGMLAILVTAGIDPQTAAWAIDALYLYVGAYTLEISLAPRGGIDSDGTDDSGRAGDTGRPDADGVVGREQRDEVLRRFSALPADTFPNTRRYATELTSGTGHERFDFTVGLMLATLL
ncbi:TetR/AcrR family transcriptional regulator [Subtercola sp. RTI3]|uniref:TetR/AcrR family transcriptional regulator n=1 Tax=Subtercola sp. RTI3 TaxID=3048639 RepID=UPI002B23822B|nr:TetR/AcrR family transcriptional regulator [Subtercola sp. RTI3]MEA9986587.1 TetR/AcrR family transcriptional regulator [Subtercola sp. RTI3]